MSDTARDYQPSQLPTVEGMDALFDERENQIESVESHLILTVAQASAHLRKPISTIYRRVKAGKFKTQQAEDGTLRIILPTDNNPEAQVITTHSRDETQNQNVIIDDSRSENGETQQARKISSAEFVRLLELIAEKDRKLEAATYRVGFLESRLEDRESQIKLLTDSQHKGGWWAKFSSWFFKGK